MKLSEPKPSHLWQDVKFGLSEAVVVIINARPNLYSAGTRISQPARGGRPEGAGGMPTYYLAKSLPKIVWKWKKFDRCRVRGPSASLDPPLLNNDDSPNAHCLAYQYFYVQVCIPVGCVPPACWPYPSMHCTGGCLTRGCLPRRVCPSACWDTHSPCEQNDWLTGVKMLPCGNFVAGGKNWQYYWV